MVPIGALYRATVFHDLCSEVARQCFQPLQRAESVSAREKLPITLQLQLEPSRLSRLTLLFAQLPIDGVLPSWKG